MLDVEKYAVAVQRARWRQRIVEFGRWKPSTYKQVWLFAVVDFGIPGFAIWSILGTQPWPSTALVCAVSITRFSGLGQSYRLRQRWRRLAELQALYASALRFPAVAPVVDDK